METFKLDYNGNSISENPFLKQDTGSKRLFRRRPIIIRDSEKNSRADFGFKMKKSENDVNSGSEKVITGADLEYGPGIVEKLRAKFSRMSDVQKRNENSSFQTQAKKFSSCDDLRTDEENQKNIRVPIAPAQELCKTDALSVGDIAGIQVENDNSNNTTTRRPAARNIYKEEEPSEVVSIVQLRRRFEKNGEQAAKLRFARDPVTLISKYHPEQMTEYKQNWRNQSNSSAQNVSYKPLTSPKPVEITTQTTSNVLKVLNDGKSNGHEASEPEFVRIARRLRRYEPEVVERPQEIIMEKGSSVESLPQSTPVRPPSYAKWSRRQAAMPVLSHNATIIRETCDITSLLPQDPHSARVSRQTIPTILTDSARSTVPLEASPPPEEPKPTYENLQDNTSQIQKSIVNIQNAIDSVFKYENPENIRDKNYWKPSTPTEINTSHKITIPGRKIEDIGSKSSVTSSPTIPNVVSITVKSGTRSYSSYDKSEEQQEIVKSPTTYTPSYNSTSNYNKTISLSSKYVEERNNKTSHAPPPPTTKLPPTTSTAINGLLSPREKPYGDDVTILKSDASNSSDTAENEQKIKNTQSVTVDESEDSITSDDDSRDGTTGSYDITTYRPHSLIFTRLSSEEEVGGDGNLINRSLISLIPEEDLPDFLVALHEKPVKYIVVEESEKPSTSSILRSNNVKKSEKAPRGTTRIRFDVEKPMAYAYYDETTAMRLLQWDDGTIVEYSYFKQFEDEEEREEVDDPTLAMIEQWESQIAASKICEMSTSSFNAKTTGDSTISPAY